jgi:hypothetical protein
MAGLNDNVNPALLDYGDDPQFWSKAYSWEPKKAHQFIMDIDGIPAYLIKSAAKPTITNGEIALDHINVKRYVKGKSSWNTISVSLYDPIVPSGAQAVMEWIRLHHESATGRDGYSTFYKKAVKLRQLSPLGEVIEEWQLNGTYITDSNFGTLDWGSEEVMTIELTLRYDWAFLSF